MKNLFTYILAMTEASNKLSVIEKVENSSISKDDGIITESSELVVRFDNGVILRRQTEQGLSYEPADPVCAECWISYEVIENPEGLEITPKRKIFNNKCQEVFWLKMNKMQLSI